MRDDGRPLEIEEEDNSIDPQHVNEELTRYVQTAVRYGMRQGLSETDVRRIVERVLNEARGG